MVEQEWQQMKSQYCEEMKIGRLIGIKEFEGEREFCTQYVHWF